MCVPQTGLFLVHRLDDLYNDGLFYSVLFALAFTGHPSPTLTAISLVAPNAIGMVFANPSQSLPEAAVTVDHKNCKSKGPRITEGPPGKSTSVLPI